MTEEAGGPAGGEPYRLPMFPLGGVLMPYRVLPLRVFEPRYRVMTRECLEGSSEFGVVLIERGFEVGGGDQRFGVGTVARIVEAAQSPDGRYGLLTVGTRRIRVEEWLPDDPYPQARVVDLEERPWSDAETEAVTEQLARAEKAVRRALGLAAELSGPMPVPATFELAEEADVAAWQLAAYAPLNQVDQLRILGEDRAAARVELVAELAEEAGDMLAFRLGSG
jgi:Lon protease-like protein